jgi:hypothetical protein
MDKESKIDRYTDRLAFMHACTHHGILLRQRKNEIMSLSEK